MLNRSFKMPKQYGKMFSEVLESQFEETESVIYELSSVLSRFLLNLISSNPIPQGGPRAW